jgi:hypothetical protein
MTVIRESSWASQSDLCSATRGCSTEIRSTEAQSSALRVASLQIRKEITWRAQNRGGRWATGWCSVSPLPYAGVRGTRRTSPTTSISWVGEVLIILTVCMPLLFVWPFLCGDDLLFISEFTRDKILHCQRICTSICISSPSLLPTLPS